MLQKEEGGWELSALSLELSVNQRLFKNKSFKKGGCSGNRTPGFQSGSLTSWLFGFGHMAQLSEPQFPHSRESREKLMTVPTSLGGYKDEKELHA